eukprot:9326358-Pyramimonas_sp.AAC.1
MAPEVLVGQPYSRESDVWSLGAVVYWIYSGINVRDKYTESLDLLTLKVRAVVYWIYSGINVRSSCTESLDLLTLTGVKAEIRRLKIRLCCADTWLAHVGWRNVARAIAYVS